MVVFFDGWETGDYTKWSSGAIGSAVVVNGGSPVHSGTYSHHCPDYTAWVEDDLGVGSTLSDAYARVYVNWATLPNYENGNAATFLTLVDTAYNDVVTVQTGTYIDGVSHFWRFYSGTTGYTNVNDTINAGEWRCVEIRRKVGAGDGIAELWIDGVNVINRTTETFANNTQTHAVGFWYVSSAYTVDAYFDDYVLDTNYIGPLSVSPALGTFLTCLGK